MSEIDVISHLMNVENQASSLIFEAQTVADKNISDARATAESLYKQKYEVLLNDLESDYSKKVENLSLLCYTILVLLFIYIILFK